MDSATLRDLLDDLDAVLGVDRVLPADVPALLRDLAPTWGPYRALSGVQLRDLLDNAGGAPRPPATGPDSILLTSDGYWPTGVS